MSIINKETNLKEEKLNFLEDLDMTEEEFILIKQEFPEIELAKNNKIKEYSNKVENLFNSQPFSYFLGGAILCYKYIFKELFIKNVSRNIYAIKDVNDFISENPSLLTKKSDFFYEIIKSIFLEPKNEKNISPVFFLKKILFSGFSLLKTHSYISNTDLAVVIFSHKNFSSVDFNNYHFNNCYSHENIGKENSFYQSNELSNYFISMCIDEFFSNITDIESIAKDIFEINMMSKDLNYYKLESSTKKILQKKVNFYYKKFFSDQIKDMFKLRQYNAYLNIGEETIKTLSYLKKANIYLKGKKPYNNNIENNLSSYEKLKKEYPQALLSSYSLIGFTGDNQMKNLKSFFKNLGAEKNNYYYYNDRCLNLIKEKSLDKIHPLSESGWKFYLSQNENYNLRAIRNLKVGCFSLNLKLNDAWLRSSALNIFMKNNHLYYSGIELIKKSIVQHESYINKYTGFKNNHVYLKDQKPIKFHVEKIKSHLISAVKEIKENKITNVEDVNFLFYFLNFSCKIINKERNIFSEKMIETINFIAKLVYIDKEKPLNEEDIIVRGYDLYLILNEDNKKSIELKLYLISCELEKLFDFSFKNLIKNHALYFHYIISYFYSTQDNNLIENQYIEVENASSQISDFIHYNYLEKIDDKTLSLLSYSPMKILEYAKNIYLKNIKDLDHLFSLSFQWHKKTQEYNFEMDNNIIFNHGSIIKKELFRLGYVDVIFNDYLFTIIDDSFKLYNEGKDMKHCIFNYKKKISDGKYIAFQMTPISFNEYSEKATLGCYVNRKGILKFNQIRSKFNRDVSEEQKKIALYFIQKINDDIKE